MNQKIRTTCSLALIAMFGLAATGCGSAANDTAATKVQVRIWRIGQSVDPIQDNINDFQKQHGTVTVSYFNKSANNYEDSALRSMASKQGPDIWSIPDDWLGDEESILAPVPDDFFIDPTVSCPNDKKATANPYCLSTMDAAKLLYPAGIVQQITSSDGKSLLGLPTNVDTLHLYVNMDMLNQAYDDFKASQPRDTPDSVLSPVRTLLNHAPQTWSELLSQVGYITQRSGTTITRSAIALGTSNNVNESADILQLLMLQNKAAVVSSDRLRTLIETTTTTSSGALTRPGESALQLYTDFANPKKQSYTWNASMPSAVDAFAQGKVAMVIAYHDFADKLIAKNSKLKPTVAPVPQNTLTEQAVNLVKFSVETVPKNADNTAASFALLKLYTQPSTVGGLAGDLGLRTPYLAELNKKTDDVFGSQVLTGQGIFKKSRITFDATFNQMITDVSQNSVATGAALDAGAEQVNKLLTGDGS